MTCKTCGDSGIVVDPPASWPCPDCWVGGNLQAEMDREQHEAEMHEIEMRAMEEHFQRHPHG